MTDTGQTACFNLDSEIECPAEGTEFFGQDGQYSGRPASFTVDADGTVTDDDDAAQRFAFDAETGALSLADGSESCPSAGAKILSAGPFMPRMLTLSDCDTTNPALRLCVVRN